MKEAFAQKSVKGGLRGIYLLVVALVFLFVGIILNSLFKDDTYLHRDARKFEKTLHKQERLLKEELQRY